MTVILSVMSESHHDAVFKVYDNYATLYTYFYYFNALHFCVFPRQCTSEVVAWKNHRFPCRNCILHL